MLDAENAACAVYWRECDCLRTYRYGEEARIDDEKA